MACEGVQLDLEIFSCPICLDVLKDPVTVPCGHNYCMDCINAYWDTEVGNQAYVCPQCRKGFVPRPVLLKNTTLAAVAEELKKTRPQGPSGSGNREAGSNAGPRRNLKEDACSRHGEVKTWFCRTDRQRICLLCSVEEHKGHLVVSAAAEMRAELMARRLDVQQMIRDRRGEVAALRQGAEVIDRSADEAVKDGCRSLDRAIHFLESQRCEVEKKVRSRQEAKLSQVRKAQEQLELEMVELRSREAELERILDTDDDGQFLQRSASLSPPNRASSLASSPSRFSHDSTSSYFRDVTQALSTFTNTLQKAFRNKVTKITEEHPGADSSLPPTEPQGRGDFLKHSFKITLDADTAHAQLHLSAGKRRATVSDQSLDCPSHPGRFTQCCQVLGKENMKGRCYWEVRWDGPAIYIAAAYADVKRDGPWAESGFGSSEKSWALYCDQKNYMFCHNGCTTPVLGPPSSRLGVYLDHSAGVLSFYSVTNEAMTLLHRAHATFLQPLRAGFSFYSYKGNKVEIMKL